MAWWNSSPPLEGVYNNFLLKKRRRWRKNPALAFWKRPLRILIRCSRLPSNRCLQVERVIYSSEIWLPTMLGSGMVTKMWQEQLWLDLDIHTIVTQLQASREYTMGTNLGGKVCSTTSMKG